MEYKSQWDILHIKAFIIVDRVNSCDSKNNNINGINYGVNTNFDNTMLTAGVNFKNGGLASIL